MNDGVPSFSAARRDVCFLVFPRFELLDLAGPLSVFQSASNAAGGVYRLHVISEAGGLITSTCGLAVLTEAVGPKTIDTLVVTGGRGAHPGIAAPTLSSFVGQLARSARRTASVCTGAFLLAAAGLLDGRRTATHWRHVLKLQNSYPSLRVAPDRIFVRNGPIWSSAGIAAGIDLALALVEDDFGTGLAQSAARDLVVSHRRSGGQTQFSSVLELQPKSGRIEKALEFARQHLREPLPVERLAAVACLSERHFWRAFKAETGETPAKAVERLRAEAARAALDDGQATIEQVAALVGFGQTERMRRAFVRLYGQPPQAFRRMSRT